MKKTIMAILAIITILTTSAQTVQEVRKVFKEDIDRAAESQTDGFIDMYVTWEHKTVVINVLWKQEVNPTQLTNAFAKVMYDALNTGLTGEQKNTLLTYADVTDLKIQLYDNRRIAQGYHRDKLSNDYGTKATVAATTTPTTTTTTTTGMYSVHEYRQLFEQEAEYRDDLMKLDVKWEQNTMVWDYYYIKPVDYQSALTNTNAKSLWNLTYNNLTPYQRADLCKLADFIYFKIRVYDSDGDLRGIHTDTYTKKSRESTATW